ncbi:MAG: MFS transporter, partial [Blastocatellia bacterium]
MSQDQTLTAESSDAALIPPHLARSLFAVILGTLILRVAAQTMSQMLQFYFARIDRYYFGLSQTVTGLVTASFFITELTGSPILGALSDRLGRKKFIILGPLFGAVAVQVTAMTIAIPVLVVTRLLEGLSTASSIPATLGYISEVTTGRPSLRARIIGMFELTFIGGVAIGAVLGGYLWNYFASPVVIGHLHLISPAFTVNGLVYLISLAVFAWGLSDIAMPSWHEVPAADPGPGQHSAAVDALGPDLERARRKTSGRPLVSYSTAHPNLAHYLRLLKSPSVLSFIPAWLAINSI